jgi:hypothetical protein
MPTRARDRAQGDANTVLAGLSAGNERWTIARLQGRICNANAATKYETSPEVLAPLECQLLTAKDLTSMQCHMSCTTAVYFFCTRVDTTTSLKLSAFGKVCCAKRSSLVVHGTSTLTVGFAYSQKGHAWKILHFSYCTVRTRRLVFCSKMGRACVP